MDELELLMKGWTDEEKQVVYDKAAYIESRIEQQKLINKGSNVNEGWDGIVAEEGWEL